MLNNISLDHKSMDELRALFGDFVGKAEMAVLNLDNAEDRGARPARLRTAVTYSLDRSRRGSVRRTISGRSPDGIDVRMSPSARRARASRVQLQVPGAHNVSNALAALARRAPAALSLQEAAQALSGFSGIRRRFETRRRRQRRHRDRRLRAQPGQDRRDARDPARFSRAAAGDVPAARLRPADLMKNELIACFAEDLNEGDVLVMPEPVYYGGTVDRKVTSGDIVRGVQAARPRGLRLPRPRRPAATRCISWPAPATASSSWAPATTRCRNSRPSCSRGCVVECNSRHKKYPIRSAFAAWQLRRDRPSRRGRWDKKFDR